MAKIMFIGDIHFSNNKPISRVGDSEEYKKLVLNKLLYCLNYSIENKVRICIILGDVFNTSVGTDPQYVTECYKVFKKFKAANIVLYSIIGNHDMYYQQDNEFNRTTLYQCFVTELLRHLDEINIGSVTIKGIDYNKDYIPISNLKLTNTYNICVAHSFYENERFGGTGNSNLTDIKCLDLGYNAYVLGHDHSLYDILDKGKYKVVRPGSLTRSTSKTCNIYRKVVVAIFDTDTLFWDYIEVPTIPGTDAFRDDVILSKQEDLNLDDILLNLEYSSNNNIYDFIDSDIDRAKSIYKDDYNSIIDIITQYLESKGVYKSNVN